MQNRDDFRPCSRCGFEFSGSINKCPRCGLKQRFEWADALRLALMLVTLVSMVGVALLVW